MGGVASSMPMHPATIGAQTTKNKPNAITDMRNLNMNGMSEGQQMTFYPSADIRASANLTSHSNVGVS